jgi:RimJ/RimL family protein N-acetyltransferase
MPPLDNFLPVLARDVLLRRLAFSDLSNFQSYRNNPDVAKYQGWSPQSDADATHFIHDMQSAALFAPGCWFQLGIALRGSDMLIGDIGICVSVDELEAEIGFSLHPDAQGRGLAKQSVESVIAMIFKQTRALKVVGATDAKNVASVKLLQALGMIQIATIDTVFKDEPCTELTFALHRTQ